MVGRTLWRSPCPPTPAQGGPPKAGYPGLYPDILLLNISEDGEFTASLGTGAELSSQWKMLEWNFCISVHAHCLWHCHWHCWEEPGSVLFAPFLQVFVYIDKILPSRVFSRLNTSSCLSLPIIRQLIQSQNHLSGLHWTPSSSSYHSCTRESQNGAQDSRCALSSLRKGQESPPLACWQHFSSCSPGHRWPPFFQGHLAALCSTSCPPETLQLQKKVENLWKKP